MGKRGPPPQKLALLFRLKYLLGIEDREKLANELNINENTIQNYEWHLKQILAADPLKLEEKLVESESGLPDFEREQLERIVSIPEVTDEEIEEVKRFLIEFSAEKTVKKTREEKARALLIESCLKQLEYALETERDWVSKIKEWEICDLIEGIFTVLGILHIREFKSNNRRVDFFLPELGTAVEVKALDSHMDQILAQCVVYSEIFRKLVLLIPGNQFEKLRESLGKFRELWFVPFKVIALEDFLLYCAETIARTRG